MLLPPFGARPRIGVGNDSFTKLLLHCDGAAGATSFSDASASAHSITANGSVQVATTSKFGTGAALFNGSTDYLTWTDTLSDFTWAGDFTIDCWVKTTVKTLDTANRHIFGGGTGANSAALFINTSGQINAGDDGVGAIITGTTDITTLGAFCHVAWIRTGSTNRLFMNGTQEGGDVTNSQTWAIASAGNIGRFAGGFGRWNGSIDEFRVSKGIARWTANFTPPTTPYL